MVGRLSTVTSYIQSSLTSDREIADRRTSFCHGIKHCPKLDGKVTGSTTDGWKEGQHTDTYFHACQNVSCIIAYIYVREETEPEREGTVGLVASCHFEGHSVV